MKRISIIMAALFLLAACNNENKTAAVKKVKYSDLAADIYKGDIQSIEDSPYKVDSTGKVGEMDSCCYEVTDYDENGNAVKYTSKDNKGFVKNESVYTRHKSGLFSGSKDSKDGGKPAGSMTVEVDDKDMWTVAHVFDSTGKPDGYYTGIGQTEYGQVTAWKRYDKDSVFREEGEAKFEKNLQVGFTVKDSVGKVKFTSISKYNDKGEQIENSTTTINKDSTTTKVSKYTYDAHDEMGNWTQRTEWDDKGKAVKVIRRKYNYSNQEVKK
jgi:hypothetical protein